MALQLMLGDRVARGLRRERVFRDRMNPLDRFDDDAMYERYRFTPCTRRGVLHLLDLLTPHLGHQTRRSHAVDPRIQVFVALKHYAQSTVHNNHGDTHGISKASASRIVRRVTRVVIGMKEDHVKFPTTPDEIANTQQAFYDVAGFPQVVSAVDCTHVLMRGANYGENAYVYVDRMRNKSINVQLMCDTSYRITNVVARWPGSSHDSRILRHSRIGQEFDEGRREGIIIGDGGYGLKSWLLTPIPQPRTPAEYAYNRAHPRTRVFIEQVNGQLKSKFRCLLEGIRTNPKEACRTIVACVVLFNIAKELKEPDIIDDNLPPEPPVEAFQGQPAVDGVIVRDQIVRDFF